MNVTHYLDNIHKDKLELINRKLVRRNQKRFPLLKEIAKVNNKLNLTYVNLKSIVTKSKVSQDTIDLYFKDKIITNRSIQANSQTSSHCDTFPLIESSADLIEASSRRMKLTNWFREYYHELKKKRLKREEFLEAIAQPRLVRNCEIAYNNYIKGEDNLPQGITLSNLNEFDPQRVTDINLSLLLTTKGPIKGLSKYRFDNSKTTWKECVFFSIDQHDFLYIIWDNYATEHAIHLSDQFLKYKHKVLKQRILISDDTPISWEEYTKFIKESILAKTSSNFLIKKIYRINLCLENEDLNEHLIRYNSAVKAKIIYDYQNYYFKQISAKYNKENIISLFVEKTNLIYSRCKLLLTRNNSKSINDSSLLEAPLKELFSFINFSLCKVDYELINENYSMIFDYKPWLAQYELSVKRQGFIAKALREEVDDNSMQRKRRFMKNKKMLISKSQVMFNKNTLRIIDLIKRLRSIDLFNFITTFMINQPKQKEVKGLKEAEIINEAFSEVKSIVNKINDILSDDFEFTARDLINEAKITESVLIKKKRYQLICIQLSSQLIHSIQQSLLRLSQCIDSDIFNLNHSMNSREPIFTAMLQPKQMPYERYIHFYQTFVAIHRSLSGKPISYLSSTDDSPLALTLLSMTINTSKSPSSYNTSRKKRLLTKLHDYLISQPPEHNFNADSLFEVFNKEYLTQLITSFSNSDSAIQDMQVASLFKFFSKYEIHLSPDYTAITSALSSLQNAFFIHLLELKLNRPFISTKTTHCFNDLISQMNIELYNEGVNSLYYLIKSKKNKLPQTISTDFFAKMNDLIAQSLLAVFGYITPLIYLLPLISFDKDIFNQFIESFSPQERVKHIGKAIDLLSSFGEETERIFNGGIQLGCIRLSLGDVLLKMKENIAEAKNCLFFFYKKTLNEIISKKGREYIELKAKLSLTSIYEKMDVDEYIALVDYCGSKKLREAISSQIANDAIMNRIFDIFEQNNTEIELRQMERVFTLNSYPARIEKILKTVKASLEELKPKIKSKVIKDSADFTDKADSIPKRIAKMNNLKSIDKATDNEDFAVTLQNYLEELNRQGIVLNQRQSKLRILLTDITFIGLHLPLVTIIKDAWSFVVEWKSKLKLWLKTPLVSLDGNEIKNYLDKASDLLEAIFNYKAKQKRNDVLEAIEAYFNEQIQKMEYYSYLYCDMKENIIKHWHWIELLTVLYPINSKESNALLLQTINLDQIIKNGIKRPKDSILLQIKEKSQQEFLIESSISKIEENVRLIELLSAIEPFTSLTYITNLTDINHKISQSILDLAHLEKNSKKYIKAFEGKINSLNSFLVSSKSNVKHYETIQLRLIPYLKFFASKEIASELSSQNDIVLVSMSKYKEVTFKIINGKTLNMFIAFEESITNLLQQLNSIANPIEEYLTRYKERNVRLLFFSNEKLFKFLSDYHNCTRLVLEGYLRQCFTGVKRLLFDQDDNKNIGMENYYNETLMYSTCTNDVIKIDCPSIYLSLDDYIKNVDHYIEISVKKAFKEVLINRMKQEGKESDDIRGKSIQCYLKNYIAFQFSYVIEPFSLLASVEDILTRNESTYTSEGNSIEEGLEGVKKSITSQIHFLYETTQVNSNKSSGLDRLALESLLSLLLSQREFIEKLIIKKVSSITSFEFYSFLKPVICFKKAKSSIETLQSQAQLDSNFSVKYSLFNKESPYLSYSFQLMPYTPTPYYYNFSEKYVISLALSIQNDFFNVSHSDHSESIQLLFNALGKICLTWNCLTSDNSYSNILFHLKACCKLGLTLVIKHYSSIQKEVLSSLIESIDSIRTALTSKAYVCAIQGDSVKISKEFHLFLMESKGDESDKDYLPSVYKEHFRSTCFIPVDRKVLLRQFIQALADVAIFHTGIEGVDEKIVDYIAYKTAFAFEVVEHYFNKDSKAWIRKTYCLLYSIKKEVIKSIVNSGSKSKDLSDVLFEAIKEVFNSSNQFVPKEHLDDYYGLISQALRYKSQDDDDKAENCMNTLTSEKASLNESASSSSSDSSLTDSQQSLASLHSQHSEPITSDENYAKCLEVFKELNLTVDNYQITKTCMLYDIIRNANDNPFNPKHFFLYGNHSTGKTTILKALFNLFHKATDSNVLIYYFNLLSISFEQLYGKDSKEGLLSYLLSYPMQPPTLNYCYSTIEEKHHECNATNKSLDRYEKFILLEYKPDCFNQETALIETLKPLLGKESITTVKCDFTLSSPFTLGFNAVSLNHLSMEFITKCHLVNIESVLDYRVVFENFIRNELKSFFIQYENTLVKLYDDLFSLFFDYLQSSDMLFALKAKSFASSLTFNLIYYLRAFLPQLRQSLLAKSLISYGDILFHYLPVKRKEYHNALILNRAAVEEAEDKEETSVSPSSNSKKKFLSKKTHKSITLNEKEEEERQQIIVDSLQGVSLSYISLIIGGILTPKKKQKAMRMLLDLLKESKIKVNCSFTNELFDYYYDIDALQWKPIMNNPFYDSSQYSFSSELTSDNIVKGKLPSIRAASFHKPEWDFHSNVYNNSFVIPTSNYIKIALLLNYSLSSSVPILLFGPPKNGKSTFISNKLRRGVEKKDFKYAHTATLAHYSIDTLMELIEAPFDQLTDNHLVSNETIFVFVDDCNLNRSPFLIESDWFKYNGWYSRGSFRLIDNASFVFAYNYSNEKEMNWVIEGHSKNFFWFFTEELTEEDYVSIVKINYLATGNRFVDLTKHLGALLLIEKYAQLSFNFNRRAGRNCFELKTICDFASSLNLSGDEKESKAFDMLLAFFGSNLGWLHRDQEKEMDSLLSSKALIDQARLLWDKSNHNGLYSLIDYRFDNNTGDEYNVFGFDYFKYEQKRKKKCPFLSIEQLLQNKDRQQLVTFRNIEYISSYQSKSDDHLVLYDKRKYAFTLSEKYFKQLIASIVELYPTIASNDLHVLFIILFYSTLDHFPSLVKNIPLLIKKHDCLQSLLLTKSNPACICKDTIACTQLESKRSEIVRIDSLLISADSIISYTIQQINAIINGILLEDKRYVLQLCINSCSVAKDITNALLALISRVTNKEIGIDIFTSDQLKRIDKALFSNKKFQASIAPFSQLTHEYLDKVNSSLKIVIEYSNSRASEPLPIKTGITIRSHCATHYLEAESHKRTMKYLKGEVTSYFKQKYVAYNKQMIAVLKVFKSIEPNSLLQASIKKTINNYLLELHEDKGNDNSDNESALNSLKESIAHDKVELKSFEAVKAALILCQKKCDSFIGIVEFNKEEYSKFTTNIFKKKQTREAIAIFLFFESIINRSTKEYFSSISKGLLSFTKEEITKLRAYYCKPVLIVESLKRFPLINSKTYLASLTQLLNVTKELVESKSQRGLLLIALMELIEEMVVLANEIQGDMIPHEVKDSTDGTISFLNEKINSLQTKIAFEEGELSQLMQMKKEEEEELNSQKADSIHEDSLRECLHNFSYCITLLKEFLLLLSKPNEHPLHLLATMAKQELSFFSIEDIPNDLMSYFDHLIPLTFYYCSTPSNKVLSKLILIQILFKVTRMPLFIVDPYEITYKYFSNKKKKRIIGISHELTKTNKTIIQIAITTGLTLFITKSSFSLACYLKPIAQALYSHRECVELDHQSLRFHPKFRIIVYEDNRTWVYTQLMLRDYLLVDMRAIDINTFTLFQCAKSVYYSKYYETKINAGVYCYLKKMQRKAMKAIAQFLPSQKDKQRGVPNQSLLNKLTDLHRNLTLTFNQKKDKVKALYPMIRELNLNLDRICVSDGIDKDNAIAQVKNCFGIIQNLERLQSRDSKNSDVAFRMLNTLFTTAQCLSEKKLLSYITIPQLVNLLSYGMNNKRKRVMLDYSSFIQQINSYSVNFFGDLMGIYHYDNQLTLLCAIALFNFEIDQDANSEGSYSIDTILTLFSSSILQSSLSNKQSKGMLKHLIKLKSNPKEGTLSSLSLLLPSNRKDFLLSLIKERPELESTFIHILSSSDLIHLLHCKEGEYHCFSKLFPKNTKALTKIAFIIIFVPELLSAFMVDYIQSTILSEGSSSYHPNKCNKWFFRDFNILINPPSTSLMTPIKVLLSIASEEGYLIKYYSFGISDIKSIFNDLNKYLPTFSNMVIGFDNITLLSLQQRESLFSYCCSINFNNTYKNKHIYFYLFTDWNSFDTFCTIPSFFGYLPLNEPHSVKTIIQNESLFNKELIRIESPIGILFKGNSQRYQALKGQVSSYSAINYIINLISAIVFLRKEKNASFNLYDNSLLLNQVIEYTLLILGNVKDTTTSSAIQVKQDCAIGVLLPQFFSLYYREKHMITIINELLSFLIVNAPGREIRLQSSMSIGDRYSFPLLNQEIVDEASLIRHYPNRDYPFLVLLSYDNRFDKLKNNNFLSDLSNYFNKYKADFDMTWSEETKDIFSIKKLIGKTKDIPAEKVVFDVLSKKELLKKESFIPSNVNNSSKPSSSFQLRKFETNTILPFKRKTIDIFNLQYDRLSLRSIKELEVFIEDRNKSALDMPKAKVLLKEKTVKFLFSQESNLIDNANDQSVDKSDNSSLISIPDEIAPLKEIVKASLKSKQIERPIHYAKNKLIEDFLNEQLVGFPQALFNIEEERRKILQELDIEHYNVAPHRPKQSKPKTKTQRYSLELQALSKSNRRISHINIPQLSLIAVKIPRNNRLSIVSSLNTPFLPDDQIEMNIAMREIKIKHLFSLFIKVNVLIESFYSILLLHPTTIYNNILPKELNEVLAQEKGLNYSKWREWFITYYNELLLQQKSNWASILTNETFTLTRWSTYDLLMDFIVSFSVIKKIGLDKVGMSVRNAALTNTSTANSVFISNLVLFNCKYDRKTNLLVEDHCYNKAAPIGPLGISFEEREANPAEMKTLPCIEVRIDDIKASNPFEDNSKADLVVTNQGKEDKGFLLPFKTSKRELHYVNIPLCENLSDTTQVMRLKFLSFETEEYWQAMRAYAIFDYSIE